MKLPQGHLAGSAPFHPAHASLVLAFSILLATGACSSTSTPIPTTDPVGSTRPVPASTPAEEPIPTAGPRPHTLVGPTWHFTGGVRDGDIGFDVLRGNGGGHIRMTDTSVTFGTDCHTYAADWTASPGQVDPTGQYAGLRGTLDVGPPEMTGTTTGSVCTRTARRVDAFLLGVLGRGERLEYAVNGTRLSISQPWKGDGIWCTPCDTVSFTSADPTSG